MRLLLLLCKDLGCDSRWPTANQPSGSFAAYRGLQHCRFGEAATPRPCHDDPTVANRWMTIRDRHRGASRRDPRLGRERLTQHNNSVLLL